MKSGTRLTGHSKDKRKAARRERPPNEQARFPQTTLREGLCVDWQPITSIQGSETFTAGEGRRLCNITAIYPRSAERRSSGLRSGGGGCCIATQPFDDTWPHYYTFNRYISRYCSHTMRPSDEMLNPGQIKSSRLSLPKFMAVLTGTTEIPDPFIFMAQRHLHPI